MARLIAIIALLGLVGPAAAQPWRYVDKNGHVNYTNNINNLPPKYRKKAQEMVDRKKLRAAAEAAAVPSTEAPASVASIAIPAPPSAAAESVESKSDEPTAHDKWRARVSEADKAVADLALTLKSAQEAAEAAQRKALITPTGFTQGAHVEAQKALESVKQQLVDAETARVRTRKAEPPKDEPAKDEN